MSRLQNLESQRFGRLVVRTRAENRSGRTAWHVDCDCGAHKIATTKYLHAQHVNPSCGCWGKELLRNLHIRPYGAAMRDSVLRTYKNEARARHLSWELTQEDFCNLTQHPCHYCGEEPKNGYRKSNYNGLFIYNDIDRKENSQGYVRGNVVPCCKICNKAKGAMSYEAFLAYLNRVAGFRLQKWTAQ